MCGERFLPTLRKGRLEMNNSKQETIADIVADIRAQNQGLPEDGYALSPLVCDLLSLADRIEAASKREREARDEMARSDIDSVSVKFGRLVKKLRSENKRLLSALKPVLDAYISQDDHLAEVYDSRLDAAVCVRAVRDANRIYKEGGEK